jgi:hypothetical protein
MDMINGIAKLHYVALFSAAAIGLDIADANLSDNPALPWNKAHQEAIASNVIEVNYGPDKTIVRQSATGDTWETDCKGRLHFTREFNLDFSQDGYIVTCPYRPGGYRTDPGTIKEKFSVSPYGMNLN